MKTLKLTFAGLLLAACVAMAGEKPSADHIKWMKDLAAQNGAIRKGVDVKKNAQDMQATLKLVGAFWKTRNAPDASKACGDSYKGAAAVIVYSDGGGGHPFLKEDRQKTIGALMAPAATAAPLSS